jgi:hypothetical protein
MEEPVFQLPRGAFPFQDVESTEEYVHTLRLWDQICGCFPRHLSDEDKQAVFGQFIRRRLRAAGFRTPGDPS